MYLPSASTALLALLALLVLLTLFIVRYALALTLNYRAARATGLPCLVCPANSRSLPWMIFSVAGRPLIERVLPAWAWRRVRVQIYGWEFRLRGAPQAELGPVFWLVTPETNKLWIAEPEAAAAVLARRKAFVTLPITQKIIGRFGPNVLTTDDEDWQRQRRIIAPLLNERIMEKVWRESRDQARQMLAYFGSLPGATTDRAIEGMRTIAMNVLGAAGYGTPASWTPDGEKGLKPPKGHKMSFLESIATIADNLLPATVGPKWMFDLPFMPDKVKRIGIAVEEFEPHADALVRQEREAGGLEASNTLTGTMVRISDREKAAGGGQGKSALHLSESEMRGAIFQFTIAGYDTTANTMAYAFTLLAVHPELQDWLAEELDRVIPEPEAEVDYESTFPKLQRCLALMFEILRLYTPLPHISRSARGAQSLPTSTGTHLIPAGSEVFISGASMHISPSLWGSDPLVFRPQRFIDAATGAFREPPKSTFVPWSGGPRYCPGMKMSQVEFVAVLATAVRSWRVQLVPKEGERVEQARKRMEGLLADSQPIVTLQMKRPREVQLAWVRR